MHRPMGTYQVPILCILCLSGCELLSFVGGSEEESGPLIQTDAQSYVVTRVRQGFHAEIPYVFSNRTGGAVYLVNCQQDFEISLERRDSARWVRAYNPPLRECLSPPIVIEAGERYRDTLLVRAQEYGSNSYPQFDREDIDGTYRIVWGSALSSYRDRHPFGDTLPLRQRISNEFQIELAQ